MNKLLPALSVLVCSVPALASAHAALVDPAPRNGENGLTMEPCGGVAPGDTPTVYTAGEMITVSWAVGQAHGGALQIDFSPGDDMGFDQNLLAQDISDAGDAPTMMEVQLPDVECEACTLRLIQVNPGEANYVSCADVQLVAAPGGSSTGAGDGTAGQGDTSTGGNADDAANDGESTAAGTQGATSGPSQNTDDSGGCGCRTSPAPGGMLLLLGLGAVARRRRRA